MNINKKNGQRGAALVEFTLVLPLLLLFLFGIIEFSVALYDKAVVTNASREAARAWTVYRDNINAVNLSHNDVEQIVTDYSDDRLITFGSSIPTIELFIEGVAVVEADADPIDISKGEYLTVTVNYTYDFLILPSLAQNLLPTLNLSAETTMRAE